VLRSVAWRAAEDNIEFVCSDLNGGDLMNVDTLDADFYRERARCVTKLADAAGGKAAVSRLHFPAQMFLGKSYCGFEGGRPTKGRTKKAPQCNQRRSRCCEP
jgi:hypothetical protein